YDENIVHAFMLGNLRLSREEIWERVVAFLPYVDNWAVCDGLASHLKYLFRDKDNLFPLVISLLESEAYTIRFGLVCLLNYYITDEYIDTLLEICVKTKSDEYYINMALAWLISFMLIKEYDKSVSLLESGVLDKWVHNKSIQKACESYRISENQKSYLKTLRR
ncbi:MAG: DNA alkylation repair protein, partial [Clostridia bacterium]|nr:DNA alkylation repair protein [Clostridia bacterium]